jgi:hypothetical protein
MSIFREYEMPSEEYAGKILGKVIIPTISAIAQIVGCFRRKIKTNDSTSSLKYIPLLKMV